MHRLLVYLTTLFLSLVSTGFSESAVSVRTLAVGGDPMPELFIQTREGYVPLIFSPVQPGHVGTVTAARTLPVFRKSDSSDAGFEVLQHLKLPREAKGILVLGWKSKESTKLVAVSDELSKAGYSDWLMINASSRAIAFKAGDVAKPLLLKAGVSCTHRVAAEKGEGVAVSAGALLKGRSRVFYSTFWPAFSDKRNVVVFVDDGERILVKRISDELPRKEDEISGN